MHRRLVWSLIAAVTLAGCGGPYSGKSERLNRPKKTKTPAGVVVGPAYDEECKAEFFEDGSRVRRQPAVSKAKVGQGDNALAEAQKASGAVQASLVIDAMGFYKKALGDDPFNAEATYKLAAAYAQVRKKGCALALLKRLVELRKHPDFEPDAVRMMKAAEQDASFRGFRKDADSALGI